MKKGKKLENLKQIDGKVDRPRTIDQILGYNGFSKYQTMDEDEYQQTLASMNKSDLNKEAIDRGLIPVENRTILESRLLREFRAHVSSFDIVEKPKEVKTNKSLSKRALDILSNGR